MAGVADHPAWGICVIVRSGRVPGAALGRGSTHVRSEA